MKAFNKIQQQTQNKASSANQRFNSETYESSVKEINSISENNNIEKLYKNSIDFFPKKMNIEEPEEKEYIRRKYTLEKNLKIKGFVPQLKPIKMYMIPSKFRLNKKGFKDLKRNQNNKILMEAKKYFISCPNLEEEESDKNDSTKELYTFYGKLSDNIINENFPDIKKNENINFTRTNLKKIKTENIPKVYSKNVVSKNKYIRDLNSEISSESDLYDFDDLNNYSLVENKEVSKINKKNSNEETINKGRNRFYSWSILDVLQKKYKLDD